MLAPGIKQTEFAECSGPSSLWLQDRNENAFSTIVCCSTELFSRLKGLLLSGYFFFFMFVNSSKHSTLLPRTT